MYDIDMVGGGLGRCYGVGDEAVYAVKAGVW